MRKWAIGSILWLLAVGFALAPSSARADILKLPAIGQWTPVTIQLEGVGRVDTVGGTTLGATLNGQALPFVFCLERETTVGVPGTYDKTDVTTNGSIHGSVLTGAPQIAWLLDNYVSLAMTPNTDQARALQAAIWHVMDPHVSLAGNSFYTDWIGALGTDGKEGNVGNYVWITPKPGTNQGLISRVPDGGMTIMLLGAALLGLETLRRRLRV